MGCRGVRGNRCAVQGGQGQEVWGAGGSGAIGAGCTFGRGGGELLVVNCKLLGCRHGFPECFFMMVMVMVLVMAIAMVMMMVVMVGCTRPLVPLADPLHAVAACLPTCCCCCCLLQPADSLHATAAPFAAPAHSGYTWQRT